LEARTLRGLLIRLRLQNIGVNNDQEKEANEIRAHDIFLNENEIQFHVKGCLIYVVPEWDCDHMTRERTSRSI